MSEGGAETERSHDDLWASWITMVAEGERDALARLYDAASPLLYGVAIRMLKNMADAEEATADVFTHVWKHGRSFDPGRGSAVAWLVMLTRSRCLDRLRARASRHRAEELAQHAPIVVTPDPVAASEADRVWRALASLPVEQRTVLEEAYFGGMSHSEVSEHFQLPLGTVKTRIRLGLLRLRQALEIPK
ncbi:MAG TPA: sigma-70 family RNA polymerase sigma factor [Bryobacteraceae bacterium]|nr:sigma-70 family RNA polymerase sigma factor [Bryobacteraceae bacterium]